MKNILVLSDFSANAAHAAMTGAMFASHMHANILLFSANSVQAATPVYAGGPTVIDEIGFMQEESKEKLKKLADSVKCFIDDTITDRKPTVHYEEGLGALGYQVKHVIESKDIEMVVMGAREGSMLDHFLTGSETFSVIDHSARPVLIVPYDSELKNLKKVIFATNFADPDVKAIHYLMKLGLIFNFRLEIVHINLLDGGDITKGLRKQEFEKHIRQLRYSNLVITELYGKDIIDRLNKLCDDSGAGILAFTHYKNSFFSRFLGKSTTRKAIEKQKTPLLIFPSAFVL